MCASPRPTSRGARPWRRRAAGWCWRPRGFAVLFGAVALKLADATIVDPMLPKPEAQLRTAAGAADRRDGASRRRHDLRLHAARAMITDRNGEILAISLPTAALYANPREMIDAGRRGAQAEGGAAAARRG